MNDPELKLKKLRTFYDDALQAQSARSNEAFSAEPKSDPLMKARLKESAVEEIQLENIMEEQTKEETSPAIPPAPKLKIAPVTVMKQAPPMATIDTTELTNKIDVSALHKNASDSLLSGHGAIFSTIEEGNETSVGHIITDQKRDRFKLLPAIGEALGDWFSKKKARVTKMIETKEVGPEIADVATREDVIKDAALRSALAPKDDYTKVARRIKKITKVNQTPTTLIIKKPSEVAAPSWTYLEGESAETETAIESAAVPSLPVLKKEIEVAVETKSTLLPPVLEAASEIAISEPVITKTPEPEAIVTPSKPEPEPTLPLAETVTEEPVANTSWFPSSVEPESEASEVAATPQTTALPPVQQQVYAAPAPDRLPRWRLAGVATLAILLGISVTLWLFGNDDTPVVVNQEEQFTPLLNADEQVAIELGRDRQALLGNIANLTPRPTSVAIIAYPTVNISGTSQTASAADVLNTLAWKAPGSFVRSITDINFGVYRNNDPFIVLKVTSFDTAFGGILEWEKMMSADLSPLFGSPVLGTFDPAARTATQIRDPYFTDVVVENIDSRQLTDETQKERIIYAFADRNTIIITTSRSTLGDLLNLLR